MIMDLTRSAAEQTLLDSIASDEVVAFLQALIQARSDYPPGDTQAVMGVVADKLSDAGIRHRLAARKSHQPSVIAEIGDGAAGPTLLYHAHADTVPPGDVNRWRHDPFAGVVEGELIFGRGAGDDKGSVAAQVMALVTLARAGVAGHGRLQLAIVADEESDALQGTRWLRDSGQLKPDYLVVGEQTANRIAVAERVAFGVDLTVYGRSAHGATPWEGENAILQTAQALSWLEARLFPRLQQKKHPFLPPATLNVGKISGGLQWNIVPDRCTVAMDRRLLPGESRASAMAEIRAVLDEFSANVAPLNYDLHSEGDVAANINTPPNHPFVQSAGAALQAVCGQRRDLIGYVQTSDGRWFAEDGLPIIIFGPGEPAVAHAIGEHITVAQLVEATRFLTLFARRWLKNTDKANKPFLGE
jgi:succinyl-diaminopimelate desuccinylase